MTGIRSSLVLYRRRLLSVHEWVPLGLTASHFLPQRKDTEYKGRWLCCSDKRDQSRERSLALSRVLQMFIRKRSSWWLSAPCPKAFCTRMPDPSSLPPARNLTVVIHSAAHSPFFPFLPAFKKLPSIQSPNP